MPHNSTRGEALLREFANNDLSPDALRQRASILLSSKDLVRNAMGLTPEERARLIDKFDQAYPTIDSQNAKILTALGSLCSAIVQLPTSAVLTTGLEKRGSIAVASGGLTDIWKGDLHGNLVAIKAFRTYPAQNLKEAGEILRKRVPTWKRLSHPNVLQFRGVNISPFQFRLVYDWGCNGNIIQYLASQPRAPRASLLFDVIKGLEYLHNLDIPHGDLKGANIVVDRKGRALLTEYGLAPINSDPSFTVAATPGAVGTSRWLAPEIITPPHNRATMPVMESKPADIFAFGMLAIEVFTGKIPFEEQKNEAIVLRISQGARPAMPENAHGAGLSVEMWELMESCWQQNPKNRPTAGEVVRRLEKLIESNENGNGFNQQELQITKEVEERASQRRAKAEVTQPRALSGFKRCLRRLTQSGAKSSAQADLRVL